MIGPQPEAGGWSRLDDNFSKNISRVFLTHTPKSLKERTLKINSSVDFGMILVLFPVENQARTKVSVLPLRDTVPPEILNSTYPLMHFYPGFLCGKVQESYQNQRRD